MLSKEESSEQAFRRKLETGFVECSFDDPEAMLWHDRVERTADNSTLIVKRWIKPVR
jgi:hypothetical protein